MKIAERSMEIVLNVGKKKYRDSKHEWISVNDDLPETGGKVLCCFKDEKHRMNSI